jgi:ribosomal protein S28E/S33
LWLSSPELKEAIDKYQEMERSLIEAQMNGLRLLAMDTLQQIMAHGFDDKARVAAVKEVLDRTGHTATEKKQIDVNISYEQNLNRLKQEAIVIPAVAEGE